MTNDNARDFRPDTVDVNDENPGIPLLGMRSKNGSLEVMAVVKRARISQPRPQGFSLKNCINFPPHPFKGKALGTRLRISTRVSAVRFYAALDLCARCSKPDSQA